MATFVQDKTTDNGATPGSTLSQTLDAAAVEGNLLLSFLVFDKGDGTTFTQPSGWTLVDTQAAGGSAEGQSMAVAMRIVPTGGTTSLQWSWGPTSRVAAIYTVEYTGVTATVQDDQIAEANSGTTSVNSLAVGPTAAASDVALGICFFTGDSALNIPFSSFSGGFVTRKTFTPSNTSTPPIYVGEKTVDAAATASCTCTVGGTGDQMAGMVILFTGTNGGPEVPPFARFTRTGAITSSSFEAAARFEATTQARIKASTTSDLATSPIYSSWVAVDADDYVKTTITGLSADTQYYYGWEMNTAGTLSAGGRGMAKTTKVGAQSFNFTAMSCVLTGSSTPVFTRMRARNPLINIMLGDMHYTDTDTTVASTYRANYENVLNSTVQKTMYAEIPTAYIWSDHDCCGNTTDKDSVGINTARGVYRQVIPSYTLANPSSTEGIYHTFEIGRIRFIMLDTRSYRNDSADTDNSSKTMLGTTQKQWLKDLLVQDAATKKQMKFLCMDPPWPMSALAGEDTWRGYTTERTELVNYFSANNVKNLMILCGDDHMVALDDGRNMPGSIPLANCASGDQTSSNKTTGYLYGPFPASTGVTGTRQYMHIQVTDTGGPSIQVTATAYDSTDAQLLTPLTMSFTVGESIYPDAIISSTNLTGAVADVDEDPDDLQNVSGSWLTAP